MACFSRISDILLEPAGTVWVAFSPASGETALLNDEGAAILEVLSDGPADALMVAGALADDIGLPAQQLALLVESHWPKLIDAGLVRVVDGAVTPPA
jgi:PqqD family protein of HPr-rel-A system